MDQVHYRGSMDLAQISGPGTRSKMGVVRGPRVHVLSSTDSFASDFSPGIINISKIAILQTKFGHHFLGLYLTKMRHIWNLSSG